MASKTETATRKPVGQNVSETRRVARLRRHARLRKKVAGTAEVPRLVVNRSSRHIHVQLVDDLNGTTVAAAGGGVLVVIGVVIAAVVVPAFVRYRVTEGDKV